MKKYKKKLKKKYFNDPDEILEFVNSENSIEIISIIMTGYFDGKFLLFYYN